MTLLQRVGRFASLAIVGFALTGCCVLPWGDGRRGGGHYGGHGYYDNSGPQRGHGDRPGH